MSVSRGCMLVELEPAKWYAIVAISEYDYDFRSAESYGPCETSQQAGELMGEHTSNPGGWEVVPHPAVTSEMRTIYEQSTKWQGNKSAVRGGGWTRRGPFTYRSGW